MEYCQPSLFHAGNSTTTTIPFDLITEILSLLPAKSLFRFQSVSKLWFSTIRSNFFVDLFLTRSKTRPRLFFKLHHTDFRKHFIFSAPEHTDNNDDDKSSSSVMARYDMTISDPYHNLLCGFVNGFVCFRGVPCNTITFCNPTTRQVVKLPDAKPNGRRLNLRLGYDPVEDQYKVLCVMMGLRSEGEDIPQEHSVCTVSSSQKQEWRKIENPTGDNYQYFFYGDTCIDGAVYYAISESSRIARFDVRSEKIDFIRTPKESITYRATLINYKGQLGGVDYFCRENLMWLLEDAERQEWSSMKCASLPSTWEDLLGVHVLTQGVNHTGELMLFNPWLKSCKPIYVYYYDFNKKSTRKVEILGMNDGDFRSIHGTDEMVCYPGHIENISFL